MPPLRPLTRAQVREFDRLAIEQLGLPGVVLMENAGRGAAESILRNGRAGRLGSFTAAEGQTVAILCGGGNNGGDGYVVARHLHEAELHVLLCEAADPETLTPDAATFRAVTVAMGLPHHSVRPDRPFESIEKLASTSLFVDGLLGTGFRGALRDPAAALLTSAAHLVGPRNTPVVALDVPSGLDVDTGEADPRTLPALRTLTFAAPKIGFDTPSARLLTGVVEVISIGAPARLLEKIIRGSA